MNRFAPLDRVIVPGEGKGTVTEAGGPNLVIELDDGRTVMLPARYARHDDTREPTDREVYGAGSD